MTDIKLCLLIDALRRKVGHMGEEPRVGDLVFEVSSWWREVDPDALGWLKGMDVAPWEERCPGCGTRFDGSDGLLVASSRPDVWSCAACHATILVRLVHDVYPVRGLTGEQAEKGFQRWENALFRKVPPDVAAFFA